MLASMYSAVSGLSAHQTKMNVIGNNIANVNTYGFKASRATFSDVFYQTMNGASAPTTSSGGTNPTQLGYGANVSSIDVIHKRSGSATTDKPLDVYINGDGFIPVKDSNGLVKFTRVGILSFDPAGNLVDSNGNRVLGFQLDPDTGQAQLDANGTTTTQGLVPIKIDPLERDQYTSISIGPKGDITAVKGGNPKFTAGQTSWINSVGALDDGSTLGGDVNVKGMIPSAGSTYMDGNGTLTTGAMGALDIRGDMKIVKAANGDYTVTYKDKSGVSQTVAATYTAPVAPATKGTFNVTVAAENLEFEVEDADVVAMTADSSMKLGTVVPDSVTVTVSTFNKAGKVVEATGTWNASSHNATTGFSTLNLTCADPNAGETITLNINTAKFGSYTDAGYADMSKAGNSQIGMIGPGDGTPIKIGQIATATFPNTDGLSQSGEGYFVESQNSGLAVITVPGEGAAGSLKGGSLEMSNVDLSREFTEMIITQRGFQANTRMITVSDEMLSELVSMKR